MKLFNITILTLLMLFSVKSSAFAEPGLTINTADSAPHSKPDNSGFYDVIVSKAFERIALKISINHLPSKRSIFNVNAGIDDGEYARIKGINKTYENLVLVDENLIDFLFNAFSKDKTVNINNWSDLKDYNVAYISGWKIYEANVKSFKSLITVSEQNELFDLLTNDRVDLILFEKWRGIDHITNSGLAEIYPSPEPLAKKGMYLYLHKRHKALVPELQKAIKNIKDEGQYDKIVESILEN